jgi:hypothetical protein
MTESKVPMKKAPVRRSAKSALPVETVGVGRTGRRAPAARRSGAKSAAYQPDRRVAFAADVLGNNRLAGLLGVARSQPSRWRNGDELPGPDVSALLVDLDHVLGRLLLVWDQAVAYDWLTGSNAFREGAQPIDVLAQRGSTDVVEALQAEASGAYA